MISNRTKRKVDRFLIQLFLSEGKRLTMQEAVDLMINYVLENEGAFVQSFRQLLPSKGGYAWKAFETPNYWGFKDSSTQVDEYIYGNGS